ncbi:hypothetical protein, partial [Salmonella sp. SAL4439]
PVLDGEEATLALVPPARARQLRAVPLLRINGRIAVAMENPLDAAALEQLDFLSRQRVVPLLADSEVLGKLLAMSYDRIEDIHV